MKLGKKTTVIAESTYSHSSDSFTYAGKEYVEKFVLIAMPWKRKIYCLNTEEIVTRKPVFAVYWHKPSPNITRMRFGWI